MAVDLEADWFSVPWRDCRHAAALAAELIREIVPPELRWRHEHGSGSEGTIGDGRGTVLVRPAEPDDCQDARQFVDRALRFVESYAAGNHMSWSVPEHLENYHGDDPISRLYHAAGEYGEDAAVSSYAVKRRRKDGKDEGHDERHDAERWYAVGDCIRHAVGIVQKWAANSTGGGHTPNALLQKIARKAYDTVGPEITSRLAAKWRFRDALGDRPATEDARLAFTACWEIGHCEAAYVMLAPIGLDL